MMGSHDAVSQKINGFLRHRRLVRLERQRCEIQRSLAQVNQHWLAYPFRVVHVVVLRVVLRESTIFRLEVHDGFKGLPHQRRARGDLGVAAWPWSKP